MLRSLSEPMVRAVRFQAQLNGCKATQLCKCFVSVHVEKVSDGLFVCSLVTLVVLCVFHLLRRFVWKRFVLWCIVARGVEKPNEKVMGKGVIGMGSRAPSWAVKRPRHQKPRQR